MQKKKVTNKPTHQPIFISSTFRDMQVERDALRDMVLPRLNEFASKHGNSIEMIDLRWGIDTASISEEEQHQKVLDTCLGEIERSRPFFIGLIGERYGWIPPGERESITELEIKHGLMESGDSDRCLFYFREFSNSEFMSEEQRQIYQGDEKDRDKLTDLKNTIEGQTSNIRHYTAQFEEDQLKLPKDWIERVTSDIIEKLHQEWGEPIECSLDLEERERRVQESFRESKTSYFVGRQSDIAKLTEFCLSEQSSSQLLMIQGEAGSGKSGLLCKVMEEIEEDCLLLPFCCGISPHSTLITDMLRYFVFILSEQLGLDKEKEILEFRKLRERFKELLSKACQERSVVMIVDGLDQLVRSDESQRMLWLSEELPSNFRLLCSLIDGHERDYFQQLGGEVRTITSIDKTDMREILQSVARRHKKEISEKVVDYILRKCDKVNSQAARNPLYLSLIILELVMMDREELDTVHNYIEDGLCHPDALAKYMCQRIDEMPIGSEEMFLDVTWRLGKIIGAEFVDGVCGLLALSRDGLREQDVEGAFKELNYGFTSVDFSLLRQMLRGHISQGEWQQWNFAHQSFRRSYQKNKADELKNLNEGLATHLYKKFMFNVAEGSLDDFVAREVIHHLHLSKRFDLIVEVMATCKAMHKCNPIIGRSVADVFNDYSKDERAECLKLLCNQAMKTKKSDEEVILGIASILRECVGLLQESDHLFRIEWFKVIIDMVFEIENGMESIQVRREVALCGTIMGDLYNEMGDISNAMKRYELSLKNREKTQKLDEDDIDLLIGLGVSYGKWGRLLTKQKRDEEAEAYYKKAIEFSERICEQRTKYPAANQKRLLVSYDNMGAHCMKTGRIEEAGEYYRKSLVAREDRYKKDKSTDDLRFLAMSYENMSRYFKALKKRQQEKEFLQKAYEARRKVYDETRDSKDQEHLERLEKKYLIT